MLELVVSSGGRHSMDMMPQSIRSPLQRHVTVCLNGAAVVANQGRKIKKENQMIKRRKIRTHQSRYMLWKI